ncbi:mediator of RNA polymerase II transcription subunit 29 [Contarinia nasturtii]|uniref:mediator of RNA polymerase II transcription subunit 29 n=1 Tax=Contarinia nasturtii TaxID=265458 RepID=UPI0012D3D402|nr:mediator of RNA polymerase II transcription subunit 29 [Contarinia nasturtii]
MNQHSNNAISSPQQPPSAQSQGSTSSTGSLPTSTPAHPTQSKTETLDNIAKVKSLTGPLRDSLAMTLKTAANLLHHNNLIDNGPIKGIDNSNQTPPRFDKHLEEFYSICDQIELHLKTSILCLQQNSASQRYLPSQVMFTRMDTTPTNDNAVSYPQYLSTVRQHIAYAKDIHDTLICAAQNLAPSE